MESGFKDWTIEKIIGEGAFGKVYKIVRKEFGHTYYAALKVIDIPQSQAEVASIRNEGMTEENVTEYFKGMVEEIIEEFTLMSKLKGYSNIVSYEDHAVVKRQDAFGWRIYIRMELLNPLFEYVNHNKMTYRDIIQLGIDICKALEICQKYNIIHRDIKPENIFVSEIGTYKLGDFGIARELEKTSSGLSKKGTKSYMAPEIYKGREYNSTVDIYSLGIVLYRFLNNNRLPFMPPAPKPMKYSDKERADLMRMSGQKMPKPANAKGRLAEIVLKACAYLPSERYDSAKDMRTALEEILYSATERKLIYPSGDRVENRRMEYVSDTNHTSDKAIEDSKIKDGTVYLFNKTEGEKQVTNKQLEIDKSERSMKDSQEEKAIVKEDIQKSLEKDALKKFTEKKQVERKKIETAKKISGIKLKKKKIVLISGVSAVVCLLFIVLLVIKNINGSMFKAPDVEGKAISETEEQLNGTSLEGVRESEAEIKEPKKAETVAVPKLTNITLKEAEEIIKQQGLAIVKEESEYSDKVKKGVVISQSPKSGTEVEAGQAVSIVVSKGIEKMTVPAVTGITEEKARTLLKKNKLKVRVVKAYSSYTKAGKVMSQSIDSGKKVKKGTVVTITISIGPKPVVNTPVPKPATPTPTPYVVPRTPKPTKKPKDDDALDWNLMS